MLFKGDQKAIRVWNLYARAYDTINKTVPYLEMLEKVMERMELAPRQRILDVGCGTGNLERKILDAQPTNEIIGIDIAEKMLEKARKKFKEGERASFSLTDFNQTTAYQDGYFDRIVSVNSFYALNNPEKAVGEFYRLLKLDGKLVITNPHEKSRILKIFLAQKKAIGNFKFLISLLTNLPNILFILMINFLFLRSNKNFLSSDGMREILRKEGFKNIEISLTYADQNLLATASKPLKN
jgi:ubiquinone/menaquinone biosynthesis C-methylase UbiE